MNIQGLLSVMWWVGFVASSGSHDNFCRDLTDYGKLYYTKINVTVCDISLEKECKNEPVSKCMEVPEIDCKVELFTNCVSTKVAHQVEVSKPVMEMKSLPWCEKLEVMEDHNKTSYSCHNVTKQHCTSLWKIVNGVKVWAGNDDCRNVTWEECKPTIQTVKWMVPKMNCTPELFTYLSFENKTDSFVTDLETCTVETRSVCSRVNRTDCGITNVRNCKESPVTKCSVVEVPVPAKDKIHKQWCLFDQNQSRLPAKDNKKESQITAKDSKKDDFDVTLSGRNARNLSFDDDLDDEIVLSEVFNRRERRRERTFSTFELNSRDD